MVSDAETGVCVCVSTCVCRVELWLPEEREKEGDEKRQGQEWEVGAKK